MTRTKPEQVISIKGAREHNLKGVNVDIPKGKLVVLSGVSGSGKSSFAMDTLYAEGQRRYVESLSSYARQFLGMMRRPEVDSIEGLSPAIAIDQHGLSHNPRSTVGTVTEIHDYLRVLFARIGIPHCPKCGKEISRQTSVGIMRQIIETLESEIAKNQIARFMILSPVVRDKRGEFAPLFKNLVKKGFEQIRVDGQIINLKDDIGLVKTNRHNIEVVIDKVNVNKKNYHQNVYTKRIQDDVEIALDLSDGLVILSQVNDKSFSFPEKPQEMSDSTFSQKFACPACNISLPEIEPRLFSFNAPQGACPECDGIGIKLEIDRTRVSSWRADMLQSQYYNTTSDSIRQELEKLMVKKICPMCNGQKLKKEALAVLIDEKSIADVSNLSLANLFSWTEKLIEKIDSKSEKEIAEPLIKEIHSRVGFLNSVGVEYLTLFRSASTLSVGEAQRIRLASQIGTGLTGVLYVLDEPTVGLHQRDTQRLIKTLTKLRDLGNTVVVVEHDEEVLNSADFIVDFGPFAGNKGGTVTATGTPSEIKKNKKSLTGLYLSGKKKVGNGKTRKIDFLQKITLTGCKQHNLKNITVEFPLKRFVCVTGVSGSGKSTLVHDTLYPAVKKELDQYFRQKQGDFEKIHGVNLIDQALLVDQSPIGRTSRSNPATYTGVFTDVRQLFSQTKEARMRGFGMGHFSFNVDGGRCEACKGQGVNKIEMQFLPDVWVECEECKGARFKSEILEVEYKDKNIAQILKLTIQEAIEFFQNFPKIKRKLEVLIKIGLDYLELGQASPTLSGGESQRLKLARELVKPARNHILYILDEPTTGLHFADVEKLLTVINELVDKGNSVIVIEHNLDVVKNADWIIDLGLEGGENGGKVIAVGTPKEISQNKNSWTGKYLKKATV